MSFSEQAVKLVNNLIMAEYKNACEKFGNKYHTLHEGYAILLEELEEVEDEHKDLKIWVDKFWEAIKNDSSYNEESEYVAKMLEEVYSTILELAQVGAVLYKIRNTIDEVKEKNEVCTDNRFKIIEKVKNHLLEATNIDKAPKELDVLDSILFRLWQCRFFDNVEVEE